MRIRLPHILLIIGLLSVCSLGGWAQVNPWTLIADTDSLFNDEGQLLCLIEYNQFEGPEEEKTYRFWTESERRWVCRVDHFNMCEQVFQSSFFVLVPAEWVYVEPNCYGPDLREEYTYWSLTPIYQPSVHLGDEVLMSTTEKHLTDSCSTSGALPDYLMESVVAKIMEHYQSDDAEPSGVSAQVSGTSFYPMITTPAFLPWSNWTLPSTSLGRNSHSSSYFAPQ